MDVSAAITLQSGFPINVQQAADSRLGGANANRPNLDGADLATPGSFADRLASADHPSATWLNPAAFSLAPTGNLRQRAAHDHRRPRARASTSWTPRSSRTSDSAAARSAQFKLEALNI